MEKQTFRANLVIYFLILNITIIISFFAGGLINREIIRYIITFLPAMLLGTLTGIVLSHRIEEKLFRKIVLIIVSLAGLVSIASGLGLF